MLKSKKCAKFCENQTKGCRWPGIEMRLDRMVGTKKAITEAAHCIEKEDDLDVDLDDVLKMELGTS